MRDRQIEKQPMTTNSAPRRMKASWRHTLELSPVGIFFVTLLATDIFVATAVMMGAMTLAASIAYAIERRLSPMMSFGLVLVLAFGTLTLAFRDEFFIKIRPTIYNTVLGVLLLAGLWWRKYFLKIVLEIAFQLEDEGWRKLTIRMACLFFVLAIANHLVWTNFSTEFWAAYKIWGAYPIMIIFFVFQVPLIERYTIKPAPVAEAVRETESVKADL